jgi:hypothetical protein
MSALDYRNAHKSRKAKATKHATAPPNHLRAGNNSDERPWWGSWMAPMTVTGQAAKRRKIRSRKEHDCRADPESPENCTPAENPSPDPCDREQSRMVAASIEARKYACRSPYELGTQSSNEGSNAPQPVRHT